MADLLNTGDYPGDGMGYNNLYLSNGNGFDDAITLSIASGRFLGHSTNTQRLYVADFNGDGMADLINAGDYSGDGMGYNNLYLSNGNGFDDAIILSVASGRYLGHSTNTQRLYIGDFNGDGMADMLNTGDYPGNGMGYNNIYFSNGNGFDAATTLSIANGRFLGHSDNSQRLQVADFNGDGITDLLNTSDQHGDGGGYNNLYLSNGNGYDAPILVAATTVPVAGGRYLGHSTRTQRLHVADFDGDGMSDLLNVGDHNGDGGGYNNLYLNKALSSTTQTKITDGFGQETNINYEYIVNDLIYSKDTNAQYPVMDYQGPIQVVSSVSTDNGFGGQNTTSYKYGGMKIHKRGRGNLGFRWMETTDEQTGIIKRDEYYQEYPYVGAVKHSDTKLSNGTLLSSSDSSYTYNGFTCMRYPVSSWSIPACSGSQTPGIVFPYPNSSNAIQNDLNGVLIKTTASTTTQTFANDNFVSNTHSEVTTTGPTGKVYKQVTDNTYGNNGSADYFAKGQLTQTSSYLVDNGVSSDSIIKTFSYNTNGSLHSETTEPSTDHWLTKTYGYDSFGNKTSVEVSGEGVVTRTSSTTYDNNGQFPVTITNALGHSETRVYDHRFGTITSQTGPNGLTTTNEYDDFGRKTATQTATGNRTEITRQWCDVNQGMNCTVPAIEAGYSAQTIRYIVTTSKKGGSPLAEITPPVKVYFDKLGREVRKESVGFDGTSIYVDTNYDAQGRVVATTSPYFSDNSTAKKPTKVVYDEIGRVKETTTPTGTVIEVNYSYQNNPLMTQTISHVQSPARDETKIETQNAIGQLLSVVDNANQTTSFEYNAQGKRTKTIDPEGNEVFIQYDKLGRKEYMIDPDMGRWDYTYNTLGELVSQKDAKNQITNMQYDVLGRMTRRTDHDGLISEWHYNDSPGDMPRNKAIGKLDTVTSSNGYQKDIYYDNYGRPNISIVNINGTNYQTDTTYDVYSRPDVITYPASVNGRFALKHVYKANGFLEKITSTDGAITYWQVNSKDANGQSLNENLGQYLNLARTYDNGGRTTWLNASRLNDPANPFDRTTIYDAQYGVDSIGNITQRTSIRNRGSVTAHVEDYVYDNLNRLDQVNSNLLPTVDMDYDAKGNIISKTGLGTYTYHATKPHAVETVAGNTYVYDDNGNMISGAGRDITWSSYNKPIIIENNAAKSTFEYGPSRARFRQVQTNKTNGSSKTTLYVGGSFEVVYDSTTGLTEYKHHIRGGGKTIATHTRKSNAQTTTEYLLRDYQNSIVAIANEDGTVKGHTDFGAFGERRPIMGESVIDQIINTVPRGYTGHEHLDSLGLIHMNGRVYDPLIGRFLSADPFVQFPSNLQSLNRYSYVLNNPMSYTDPSGFWSLKKKLRHLGNKLSRVTGRALQLSFRLSMLGSGEARQIYRRHSHSAKFIQGVGAIADIMCGGCGLGSFTASGYIAYMSGGSANQIGKSALRAGAIAYAAGQATNGINDYFDGLQIGRFNAAAAGPGLSNVALQGAYRFANASLSEVIGRSIVHGFVGGATAHLMGGEIKDGFALSALLSGFSEINKQFYVNQTISTLGRSSNVCMFCTEMSPIPFGYGIKVGGNRINVDGTFGKRGLLGGYQPGPGQIFGIEYSPGSFGDWLVEGFSGTHDQLNSYYYYAADGSNLLGKGDALSWANVAVAAPIVLPALAQPYVNVMQSQRYYH